MSTFGASTRREGMYLSSFGEDLVQQRIKERTDAEGGTWNQTWNPGMTLRDWFAGQVLVGLLSSEGPDFA
jgi:hypothetical protein